jgi:hypothetical protein
MSTVNWSCSRPASSSSQAPADGLHFLLIEHPQLAVGLGGRFFDKGQGFDHVLEVLDEHTGDGEILHGPQGLHTVVDLVGQFPFSQGIVLGAHIPDQLRGFRSGDTFSSHAQPVADARGHPGNNAVEDIRLLLYGSPPAPAGKSARPWRRCG